MTVSVRAGIVLASLLVERGLHWDPLEGVHRLEWAGLVLVWCIDFIFATTFIPPCAVLSAIVIVTVHVGIILVLLQAYRGIHWDPGHE